MIQDDRKLKKRLGIPFPDDGQRGPDYELLRLDPWLARHGLAQVGTAVAFSPARRFHTREDLLVTGCLETCCRRRGGSPGPGATRSSGRAPAAASSAGWRGPGRRRRR